MMHPSAADDYNDDDDDALDGGAARTWIRDALREYEHVAVLCNAQSLLAYAAAAASATAASANPSHPPPPDRVDEEACPRALDAELRRWNLHASLVDYHAAIDDVRRAHASLRARLDRARRKRRDIHDDDYEDNDPGGGDRRRRRRPSNMAVEEAFARHVELAERVIRTAMRAPGGGAGPGRRCGVLFENGIVDAPSAADHEANVVALASLRASVSRLTADFGGGGGAG
jgi:hypothetical protein